eukprot:scaffold18.g1996.t1
MELLKATSPDAAATAVLRFGIGSRGLAHNVSAMLEVETAEHHDILMLDQIDYDAVDHPVPKGTDSATTLKV